MTENKKTGSHLDPNRVDNVEGGIIAFLWRQILIDLKLQKLLPFLAREASKLGNKNESEANKAKSRTQLINQATATTMTFKIFIRLLRLMAGVTKIRLTIEIERANGRVSTHSTGYFNIGSINTELPEESLPKELTDKIRESEVNDNKEVKHEFTQRDK